MTMLDELQDVVGAVSARVGDATVAVGGGSGVVIAPGRILTNAHNLRSSEPVVGFAGGRHASGRAVGVDGDADLAVVDVDTGDAQPVDWSDATLAVGDVVLAVANPRGRGARVTFGLVSATGQGFRGPRGRLVRDAVEHTAPLPRGSSGGPLADRDGRLVGVNTHRRGEGFYLALPATADLRQRVDALGRGEVAPRPTLGIAVAPAEVARRMRAAVGLDDQPGLLVREVEPEGAAGRAGVRRGDLVVAVDGQPVSSGDDLVERLERLDGGATVTLRIVRGSDELQVSVGFGPTREEGSA